MSTGAEHSPVAAAEPARDPTSTSGDKRIVLLIAEGPMGWSVANWLHQKFPSLVVIEEPQEDKWLIVRRRARMLGWVPAIGQMLGGMFMRIVSRLSRGRRLEIQQTAGLQLAPRPSMPLHRVPSHNAPECQKLLREIAPAVVAVYGTRILHKGTLGAVPAPFINYHAGINPKYRGQQPAYWALVNRDVPNAGVTIHLVDDGVDTGDILYQATVDFSPRDNISTHQWHQLTVAMPLFARAIEDGLTGRLSPRRSDLPSMRHFPPTLWAYLWYGLTRRVW